jgi:hypothetical protein
MSSEDYIEKFIRENRDKFTVYGPPESHMKKFLLMLNLRLRNTINIVPHLWKVAIITTLIFLASIFVWNNYLRKDREYITLRVKFYDMVDQFLK